MDDKQNSVQNYCVGSTAGLLDQAHEHLKEAVYLYGRVCDDLHPEACYCHSLLAKVAFLQGKAAEVGNTTQLYISTFYRGRKCISLSIPTVFPATSPFVHYV